MCFYRLLKCFLLLSMWFESYFERIICVSHVEFRLLSTIWFRVHIMLIVCVTMPDSHFHDFMWKKKSYIFLCSRRQRKKKFLASCTDPVSDCCTRKKEIQGVFSLALPYGKSSSRRVLIFVSWNLWKKREISFLWWIVVRAVLISSFLFVNIAGMPASLPMTCYPVFLLLLLFVFMTLKSESWMLIVTVSSLL